MGGGTGTGGGGGSIEHTYQIRCKGRASNDGREALTESVEVLVQINQKAGYNILFSTVDCKYNYNKDFCKASHGDLEILGIPIKCPYRFTVPSD